VASEPFELTPAVITVDYLDGTLLASIDAPAFGYRLIDLEGSSIGPNPVHDATVTWTLSDFTEVTEAIDGLSSAGVTTFELTAPDGAIGLTLTDSHGNTGAQFFDTE
jgi:hypothetical protein